MRKDNGMKILLGVLFALLTILLLAGGSQAANFYLRADITNVTMPGTDEVVQMWGFALDSSFGAMDGIVNVPGPTLTLTPGDQTLTIYLDNNLPENISLLIPSLHMTNATAATPTRRGDGRAISMTYETPAGNSSPVSYRWINVDSGTYLYMSGTNPAKQVQMGLYGALTKDQAASTAYTGVPYDKEIILFYSEIDPSMHTAIAADDYGTGKTITSAINYDAKYFLVNGSPYPTTASVIRGADNPGDRMLLRFLNAGLDTHVPSTLGAYMQIVAEDGRPLLYPQERYTLPLPSGKTADAILVTDDTGKYVVYDRRLNLTNYASAEGGMLTYVGVGMAYISIQKNGSGTGTVTSSPAGIDCGLKCAELYDPAVEVTLTGTPDTDSVLTAWSQAGCVAPFPCTFTVAGGDTTITATFSGRLSISGTVRTASGSPLPGVAVALSGTITDATVTDGTGNFQFTSLRNGSYAITPSLAGFAFSPSARSVTLGGASLTGQNFSGTPTVAVYSITGTVRDALNAPLPGVTLALSGAASRTAYSGVLGQYAIGDLAPGSYTVTPSKAGYTFTPVSLDVNIVNATVTGQDFAESASSATYAIAGYVRTASGAPVSGADIALGGAATASAATDARGYYRFTGLANGAYTVTPSKTGYTFTPSSRAPVVSGASLTAENFTVASIAAQGASIQQAAVASGQQAAVASGGAVSSSSVRPVTTGLVSQSSYAISGMVRTSAGVPIEGVRVAISGDADAAAVTNSRGYYRIGGLKRGSYKVSPTKAGWAFKPQERNVTITGANIRKQNFVGTAE